ncbi:hypothetical protein [Aureispira anguillae]|uniref:BioF2-like acetyltransferase domain-containing protein n=1 Tax=Aureispira anguillae TaxID=2864201 RepID=A0A916DW36_9BACT|nr:hypothetical protein [Aureispira anguillae]BDS15051.1 hypothetical protein AsAng_0058330 [Aureispira anguillae]
MEVRLLKRDEIDVPKWNGCVHYAANSKIYGYTWYLDNVTNDWMGLVEGDYQSVFPLVWNDRMLKIKQIYQPFLCQQLGLFTVNVRSKERIAKFLEAIPSDFKYWDIALNDGNRNVLKLKEYEVLEKQNYHLDLNKPYDELYQAYSKNIKRNIKKAKNHNLFLTSNLKPETFVAEVKKAQIAKGIKHPEALYHTAHRIIWNCLHRGKGVISAAFDTDKNLCAATFFMFDGAAIITLLNVSTAIGKEVGAMAYLLDATVQREAERLKYIDFEGSSVPGIARFYKSFGAQNVPYFQLKNNELPWWIKWRKK